MNFSGRHVIVTGASTGIGFATARTLSRRGAHVSLLARSADKLADAVAMFRRDGGSAASYAVDVGDRDGLAEALDSATQTFGPASGLFANAGTGGTFCALEHYSDEQFDIVLRTNLTSVFWAMKHVLPAMTARGKGAIVVTGSLASQRGIAGNAAYVAAKHGLIGLAMAAAAEAASSGVRVNAILPGLIETPMLMALDAHDNSDALITKLGSSVPQARIGTADEVSELVCFLLSDAASHITAQSIAVDGGMLGTLSLR